MNHHIETEKEVDGRWLADIPSLPGVMAYGPTREDAIREVSVIALRVIADLIEQGKYPFTRGIDFLQVLP